MEHPPGKSIAYTHPIILIAEWRKVNVNLQYLLHEDMKVVGFKKSQSSFRYLFVNCASIIRWHLRWSYYAKHVRLRLQKENIRCMWHELPAVCTLCLSQPWVRPDSHIFEIQASLWKISLPKQSLYYIFTKVFLAMHDVQCKLLISQKHGLY